MNSKLSLKCSCRPTRRQAAAVTRSGSNVTGSAGWVRRSSLPLYRSIYSNSLETRAFNIGAGCPGFRVMGPKFKLDSYDLALVVALALFIVVAASLAFA